MFSWASPQPLPPRLWELLERAQAIGRDWSDRHSADALIFLPPDQVLSCGQLPHSDTLRSYGTLLESSEPSCFRERAFVLLNGARLLGLSSDELAGWRPGLPLPRACAPQAPAPLEAALTSALLAGCPELLGRYFQLDQRSERGSADVDESYTQRLHAAADADKLVDAWNQHLERRSGDLDVARLHLQFLEVEQECEKQFLEARQFLGKLSWYRRNHRHALNLVSQYSQMLRRVLLLKVRVL